MKLSQKNVQRLKKKVNSLKTLVTHLKEKCLVSDSSEEVLNKTFSDIGKVSLVVMKRMTSTPKNGRGKKYPNEILCFALTLQFYSSKACEYVRQNFNLSLPSQGDLRRRYSNIPADPGFTEPAFSELKKKVKEAEDLGKSVLCSLTLVEMANKMQVYFDGKNIMVLLISEME